MNKRISVGLDVGMRHLNMVKLKVNSQGWKMLNFASVALNPKLGEEEKIRQIARLGMEKEIAGYPVNIGVSGESVIVRYINLPKMSSEEVRQSLTYEAQQYIPFKIEEVIFDYHILEPESEDGKRMKILLVAAKKRAIMEFIQVIQKAGLKPKLIDVNAFSLINCFQKNGPKINESDVFAIVNLEFNLVNINIFQGEVPFFTRDISSPENIFSFPQETDKEIGLFESMSSHLVNLSREIRLSIDYFESEFEKRVELIYLSGEGAKDRQVTNFFASQLDREIKLWNPVQNLIIDSTQVDVELLEKTSCMLALACGLALRGVK
jgi:type IV pilus assembly protein PilM